MIRVVLMTDFSEAYANKIIKGLASYSFERNPIVLCKMPMSVYASGGIEKVLEFAVKWKADAIIGQFHEKENLDIFKQNGIIVVSQDYRVRFKGITNITADYVEQGREAARYFIKQGVRNFGFYGLSGMVWSDERRDGFLAEISKSVSGATVSITERSSMDEIWWYDLSKLTAWLKSLIKPVAILACDDNMAFHIIEACNQANDPGLRIPDDVMLLGVDDDEPLCLMCSPTLSSFNTLAERAGFFVAKQLDERMKLPMEERMAAYADVNVMPGPIVTRKSTDIFFNENPYVKKVCDYIRGHYTENVKVDDLVDLVPMSRRMLEKLFLREMKVSIHQFIIKLRVDKMISLMNKGNSPQEAADAMGMDPKALSRSFKMVMGVPPTEYKKSLAKKRESL
ncbi:MAG: substrate-binding domain-containing protein [Bacteroidales bacterium]|nr:substrate-binding domain-containing protein [Bacteroidales bacterium]